MAGSRSGCWWMMSCLWSQARRHVATPHYSEEPSRGAQMLGTLTFSDYVSNKFRGSWHSEGGGSSSWGALNDFSGDHFCLLQLGCSDWPNCSLGKQNVKQIFQQRWRTDVICSWSKEIVMLKFVKRIDANHEDKWVRKSQKSKDKNFDCHGIQYFSVTLPLSLRQSGCAVQNCKFHLFCTHFSLITTEMTNFTPYGFATNKLLLLTLSVLII